jgi:hypothetical protein
MEEFLSYLQKKKIDAHAFKQHEPVIFAEWAEEFGQMHPESFTSRKKYFINPIRRKYLLKSPSEALG